MTPHTVVPKVEPLPLVAARYVVHSASAANEPRLKGAVHRRHFTQTLPVDQSLIARNPDEFAMKGIRAGQRIALTDPTLHDASGGARQ